ncbi:hypothetical protein ACFL1M_00635 [Patescibacteria group bacterium]
MARLWEVAYYTRKGIRYGSISLVVLIIGRIVLGAAINLYKELNPPPPPPPTVGHGKLPPMKFPKQKRPEIEYHLETVSGTIPTPMDKANVYFMPITRPNLLGLERGTQTAASLGFVFEPEALNERLYRFSRTTPIPSRLDYDIVTGNFKMKLDWYENKNFLQQKFLPNESQALSEVRNYLNKADLLERDMDEGGYIVTFLAAKGKGFKVVSSLSEADFVQVDLFRNEIDEGFENVTTTEDKGIVRVILSGSREQGQRVAQVEYDYFPVDIESAETYPVKAGVSAWEELVSGGGHIVSSPNEGSVTVRSAKLGFYDSYEPQNYLQPVYIFTGDEGFKAIVPAVDPVWIQELIE